MRGRGLLIATVLFAALAGVIYWSNKQKAKEELAPPPSSTSPKIVSIAQPDMTRIELKKPAADVVLEKSGNDWRITAPEAYNADQDIVNSVASGLSALTADNVVEQKASNLDQFGLVQPSETVVITGKGGKTQTVLFGDEAPTGGQVYTKVSGDNRIFTVASFTRSSFDKSLDDLRDKRLLTIDSGSLARVELEAKKQDMEFGKNSQGDWQILKPAPYRADALQVEELIRKLKDAKMDLTMSDEDRKKAIAAFPSATLVATAKLTDSSTTQQLELRKTKSGDAYVKSSAVPGVWKASTELSDGMDKSIDDFRNKKLFDFGFDDPGKIEIHDGAKFFGFVRSGDKWFQNGKELDSMSIQSFIDKLREIAASQFVDSGFTTPTMDITVVSKDNKRTEKAMFVRQGANYIAKRASEPTLYQVPAAAIDDLEKAAAAVKPLAAKK